MASNIAGFEDWDVVYSAPTIDRWTNDNFSPSYTYKKVTNGHEFQVSIQATHKIFFVSDSQLERYDYRIRIATSTPLGNGKFDTTGTYGYETCLVGLSKVGGGFTGYFTFELWRKPKAPLTGKMKDMVAGDIIKFAGSPWTILEPSTGYLFKNAPVTSMAYDPDGSNGFNPADSNNVGYYLNTTYFNTLPAVDKSAILLKTWVLDYFNGSYVEYVSAKIGMLSKGEWEKYSKMYGGASGFLSNPTGDWMYTRTRASNGLILIDTSGALRNTDSGHGIYGIQPSLYINAETSIVNGAVSYNAAPTVTLNTTKNSTLYENDTFNIEGTVSDTDVGDTVTVRYQIGAGTVRAIKAFLSTGALESFGKQLTFRGGYLFDGDMLIASVLTDGVAHTLKVWATDDKGTTSTIIERTFHVVPNRAPSLTVDAPVIVGNIDSDKFTISGTYIDADSNTTTVKYRVNGGNSVQVASGTSGIFDFELSFGQLVDGLNTIVVEAIDSYGAKTSKTVKLNKNVVSTEQLRSSARYKILPPTNTAEAVLLWIEHDQNLDIDVSISMTMAGEAESFVPVTATESVPIANGSTTYEDTFFYEAASAKDNIIVQIDMKRQSVEVNDKITLISGVLE